MGSPYTGTVRHAVLGECNGSSGPPTKRPRSSDEGIVTSTPTRFHQVRSAGYLRHTASPAFRFSPAVSSFMRSSPYRNVLDPNTARTLARLQRELAESIEEIQRLEVIANQQDIDSKKVEELQGQLSIYRENNSQLNEWVTSLNEQLEEAKNAREQDQLEIQKLRLELEEAAADFEQKAASLAKQLDFANATIGQLELDLQEKEHWIAILQEKDLKWTQLDEAALMNDRISPPSGGETNLADSLLRTEVDELSRQLEDAQADVERLARDCDQLREKNDELEADRKRFQEQEKEIDEANQLLEQSQLAIDQLILDCNELQERNRLFQEELERIKEERHEENQHHQQDLLVNSLEQRQWMADQQEADRKKAEDLEDQLVVCRRDNSQLNEWIKALNERLEESTKAGELGQQENQKLRVGLEELTADLESKANQLDSAEASIQQLKSLLQEKEQWIAVLQEKDLKWRQLEEAARQSVEELNRELTESRATQERLMRNCDELREVNGQLQDEVKRFQEQADDLGRQREQLTKDCNQLRGENDQLQSKAKEFHGLEEKMNELARQLEASQADAERLTQACGQLHEANSRLQDQLEQERIRFGLQLEESQRDVQRLTQECHQLNELLENEMKNLLEHQSKTEQVSQLLDESRSDAIRLTQDCNQLKEKNGQLEAEIKQIHQQMQEKEQQYQQDYLPIFEHRKEVAALTVRLGMAQTQLKQTQTNYVNVAVRLEKTLFELDQEKKKVARIEETTESELEALRQRCQAAEDETVEREKRIAAHYATQIQQLEKDLEGRVELIQLVDTLRMENKKLLKDNAELMTSQSHLLAQREAEKRKSMNRLSRRNDDRLAGEIKVVHKRNTPPEDSPAWHLGAVKNK